MYIQTAHGGGQTNRQTIVGKFRTETKTHDIFIRMGQHTTSSRTP